MPKTMEGTKIIDVRGLSHGEREKLIFPAIENLQAGEAIRLVFEFNPVPLTFMLKAREGFTFAYETEGPIEWVLKVTRIEKKSNEKAELKQLLKELKQEEVSGQTKEKVKNFFQSVDAQTLGTVEQELINEGVTRDEIRKSLCDIHLEILRDSLVAKRINVSSPHPVHTFMEEHKVILSALDELAGVLDRTEKRESFQELEEDKELLKDIAHHLVEAESHHRREEEVLFEKLAKHNIVEPAEIMKMDHVDLRVKKQELKEIVHNVGRFQFADFKKKLNEVGGYLVKELQSHIFKEDNILYQIALQTLSEEEWAEVKKACDAIGYCCFTPKESLAVGAIALDLRQISIMERHEKIFEEWARIEKGQTLRIINDHDPKPLWYQFEVEYKDRYLWEYEQKGPQDWIVKISKK